jgi:alpha-ketoglutarate-dependent 2,4-dichlorophenoxyacetate dioxygenase
MTLTIQKLHPTFCGEVGPIDLGATADPGMLTELRAAMDEHAVLVFHDQQLTNRDQIAFAGRLGGELNRRTLTRAMKKERSDDDSDAIANISNLDADGDILPPDDRRRLFGLADRLWHTDATFNDPPGRYSMLYGRIVPPAAGDTHFADMRAAYDALPDETKSRLEGLRAFHSIAHSRATLGFEMTAEELAIQSGAWQPLVRTIPATGRRSLYLASHASMIEGWPVPEGRMFLHELIEHATRPQFVYRHAWRSGDVVIWDNRTTMHRASAFDDRSHKRDMRRVTTLDIDGAPRLPAT